MAENTLEAFGMTREQMEEANQRAADQMLPMPYDIPGEEAPVQEDRFGDTAQWAAKDAWEEAKRRFQSRGTEEGVAGAIPDADSGILNTFATGLGYAADMGLAGLEASDAAWKYSVGLASELVPGMDRNQERRFTRDVSSIPDAFMGSPTTLINPRLPDRQTVPESSTPNFNTYLYDGVEDFGPMSLKKQQSLQSELDLMMGPEVNLTPQQGYESLLKDLDDTLLNFPEGTITFEKTQKKKQIFEELGQDRLIELASQLPHWQDPQLDDFYQSVLNPLAKELGIDSSVLRESVNDMSSFLPQKRDPLLDSMTEVVLPDAAPIGPRASSNAPTRPSDTSAENLGFLDTVYHTSDSPTEFTSFDLSKGSGGSRSAQDLLGVHVGTARAAAERNFALTNRGRRSSGFTMELRARTDKPLTKEKVEQYLGSDVFSADSTGGSSFSERDIGDLIQYYEGILFPSKNSIPEDSLDQATEVLRRDLARSGYTHIPYINDVEDPGSTSFIMLVDRPEDSPAVLRDVRAEFNPDKITDPDLRFAEGGLAVDNEMKTMMAEGGIKDDGMKRDPVSGNEIPAGSLAKEVRDDVPAQLSEGEYVVPADVVRYFGVNYFEKLRAKAKAGLEEMDADGRIGGDPVPAGDDLPFTDEELMSIEDQPVGMAEGGSVASGFDASAFQPGFSFGMTPTAGTGSTTVAKTFINDAGEIRSILFVNGQPTTTIPEGFYEDTPENREAAAQRMNTTVEPVSDGGRDRDRSVRPPRTATAGSTGDGLDFSGFMSEEAIQKLNEDPLAFGSDALKGDEFFDARRAGSLGALAGPVGMVAGAIGGGGMELENIARARAALRVAKSQGLEDTEGYRALQKQIDDDVDELSGVGKLLNMLPGFGTGERYADSLSQTPQAIPTGTPAVTVTPSSSGGSDRQVTSGGVNYTQKSGSDDNNTYSSRTATGSTAPTTSVRPSSLPSRPTSSSNERKSTAEKNREKSEAAARKLGTTASYSGTGRATGGLVTKPKKKPIAKK